MVGDINRDGFELVRGVLNAEESNDLLFALGPIESAGRRGMLVVPEVAALSRSSYLLDIVRPHLLAEPVPVRAIYFNKTPETNWLVSWHQDLTLAVRTRAELAGFGPWSVKDGILHVQPPSAFLEQMIAVRLHFDDTDESNGALRVLPGSHRFGRLSTEQIAKLRDRGPEVVCCASAGDLLLMRPLLLHSSSRSTSNRPRRVLHIEYAACTLPEGLDWNEAA